MNTDNKKKGKIEMVAFSKTFLKLRPIFLLLKKFKICKNRANPEVLSHMSRFLYKEGLKRQKKSLTTSFFLSWLVTPDTSPGVTPRQKAKIEVRLKVIYIKGGKKAT